MKTKKYNKLVRDKIPEIIERDSKRCVIRKVCGSEKLEYLFKKLLEEVQELYDSRNIEELADVEEVLISICKNLRISEKKLEATRKEKAESRGSFDKGIVLLEVKEIEEKLRKS